MQNYESLNTLQGSVLIGARQHISLKISSNIISCFPGSDESSTKITNVHHSQTTYELEIIPLYNSLITATISGVTVYFPAITFWFQNV